VGDGGVLREDRDPTARLTELRACRRSRGHGGRTLRSRGLPTRTAAGARHRLLAGLRAPLLAGAPARGWVVGGACFTGRPQAAVPAAGFFAVFVVEPPAPTFFGAVPEPRVPLFAMARVTAGARSRERS